MAYLTVEEYVARYGAAETIRLTDELRTGDFDTAKVEEAVEHASNEVDGYIGKRYAVPLAGTPPLIRGFVEVLARERLHTTRPTPTVEKDAERVRAQLRDIAKGVMSIPNVDEGVVEAIGGKADSAASGDGMAPVFSEENLAGFGVPSGYELSRWRV